MSYPDGCDVLVKYPLTKQAEHGGRSAWPWLPGWIVSRCGPDEWEICVETPELAIEHDGETVYPCCYRDSSKIQARRDPDDFPQGRPGPGGTKGRSALNAPAPARRKETDELQRQYQAR
jgi:hypothetical protein